MLILLYYGKKLTIGFAEVQDTVDIFNLLQRYKKSPYLKPRSYEYIRNKISCFICVRIHNILYGVAEIREVDEETYEIGAFVVSSELGEEVKGEVIYTIIEFIKVFSRKKDKKLISLTNNPGLQKRYKQCGGEKVKDNQFNKRKELSPGVDIYMFN